MKELLNTTYIFLAHDARYNVLMQKIKERLKITNFIYAKYQGREKVVYFNGSLQSYLEGRLDKSVHAHELHCAISCY